MARYLLDTPRCRGKVGEFALCLTQTVENPKRRTAMMRRVGRSVCAGIIVISAISLVACRRRYMQPQDVVSVTINYIDGKCTIQQYPVINSGQQVEWSVQPPPKSFEVDFTPGSSANPGSPFKASLGTGHQATFPSANGAPVRTGEAERTAVQIFPLFRHDFLIETVTVNGAGCYSSSPTPNQYMKVHVN